VLERREWLGRLSVLHELGPRVEFDDGPQLGGAEVEAAEVAQPRERHPQRPLAVLPARRLRARLRLCTHRTHLLQTCAAVAACENMQTVVQAAARAALQCNDVYALLMSMQHSAANTLQARPGRHLQARQLVHVDGERDDLPDCARAGALRRHARDRGGRVEVDYGGSMDNPTAVTRHLCDAPEAADVPPVVSIGWHASSAGGALVCLAA
jgi:hypothetical protein